MKIGACAALIDNPSLAREIIAAVKQGTTLPVSVKTRIGTKRIATEDWLGFLLNQKLSALTVHGRTAKELSAVPAHWDEIAKVVNLRNEISPETIVIGNGDVKNALDAKSKWQTVKVDGMMIGRGVFENIACFNPQGAILNAKEKTEVLKRHITLWDETWGAKKNFSVLKKYVKIYIRDFDGASDLRAKLMETESVEELLNPPLLK
jgi:tRNA-dihydrouridine synthase